MTEFVIIMLVKMFVIFGAVMLTMTYITLAERKILGYMQIRPGPNRVGPWGLLQPIADGIKLFLKEDIIPDNASKAVFVIAPAMALIPAVMTIAVVPFGPEVSILGRNVTLFMADINIGILYIFAVSSIGVYGIVLAGWSSESKYSLLGGLRSSAQMISYELSMGFAIVGVIMMSQSLSMVKLIEAQKGVWFIIPQFLGFAIYITAAIAELNRTPFDLPEGESELVSGYFTEYSSMKYAMFMLAEYINIITVSGIVTTLYLGGWHGPVLPPLAWFVIKLLIVVFFMIWVRATLPRLRYDQLMTLGWKILLPASIVNILLTAVFMTVFG
ncbi:MAG: NADH-quinone oxidoreductase subunit NuoH [Deltaproteobacteria bacterium]|nr:NADH-quinone oxidoreductase subunit NuoH [Deltaproteobacteria bacterium]